MKKIVEEFSKEEIKIIEEATGMKITNKKYSYDEVSNMKINVEWAFIQVSNSKRRNIVKRLNEICQEYDECFSFKRWKHKLVYTTKDLRQIIDSYNIIDKKIKSVFLTDDTTLYKNSMLVCYNNSDELSNNPDWTRMKKITEDMIPDKIERTNLAWINSPLVIVFDDDSTLEFYLKGYSKAYVSQNQLKEKYKYNLDVKAVFKDILNQKIIKYKIKEYGEDHSDNYYMDKRIKCEDNIWYIKFYLENGLELAFYPDHCLLMTKDGKETKTITIGEWKKHVKHYDWLFDNESEPRYSDKVENTKELSDMEKALIMALNHTNLSRLAKMNVMTACQEKENIYYEVLKYIMEQYHSGKIEEVTESILLEIILKSEGIL